MAKVQEFTGHIQAIYCMCLGANTNEFYSAAADGYIIQWQIGAGNGNVFAKLPSPIYSIFYAKNLLYAGTSKGEFFILNIQEKKLLQQLNLNCGGIFSIEEQEEKILIGAENGCLFILEDNKFISEKISDKSIRKIVVDNDKIILGCSDSNIYHYNIYTKQKTIFAGHRNTVFALAKNGNTLFSGGRDAQLFIWQNNELKQQIAAHLLHINDISVNTESQLLATCSMDKTIKIWHFQTYELLKVINFEKNAAHTSSINKILWIDKNKLISCSDDRKIIQFNITQ